MVVICSTCTFSWLLTLGNKNFCRVAAACSKISTHSVVLKNRCGRGSGTVGVPAWAKAAKKRRAHVLLLEKQQTPAQRLAELRLLDKESNKSDFMASCRIDIHQTKNNQIKLRKSSIVSLSIGNMLVFYHPKQNHPIDHSKTIDSTSDPTKVGEMTKYANSVSEAQLSEIRSLQKKDPKLWTVNILSEMFKIKPMTIIDTAPLGAEQQQELQAELEFLARLNDYEKKEYEYFKMTERRKYLARIKPAANV